MADLADVLAKHTGNGYVLSPAGFGKTHLIAEAVLRAERRQLVLTHTFAGVSAIRRKMRLLRVPSALFHIDTIASWALRLACAYPGASKWTVRRPDGKQWAEMYAACGTLLDLPFGVAVLRASYAGLYVDEYQDCAVEQHELVGKIANVLPCRRLGDYMQGIFEFGGQRLIDWTKDVVGEVESLGELQTAERWNRNGAPQIGTWLRQVRQLIEEGKPIDLTRGLPNGVRYIAAQSDDLFRVQANACRYLDLHDKEKDTVAAIHGGAPELKAKCHTLARQLSGLYSSIEEIEGKDLFGFFGKIAKETDSKKKLQHLIAFAKATLSTINENLSAATKRGDRTDIRGNTKNPEVARAANAYLEEASSANMLGFLQALRALSDINIVRGDLFDRATGVLRKHIAHPLLTLDEAVERYQSEFRHRGRFGGRRRIIGTTHLLKGLEFEHAIVLDAASLTRNHLYVALTRGAKSLTIVSTTSVLQPSDNGK